MHGIRNIMAGRLTQFRSGKNAGKHWQYFVCVLTFISASSIFILPRFPSPKLSSLRIFSATSDLACLKISISCFLISSSPTFPFFHLPILHIPIFSTFPFFPPSHFSTFPFPTSPFSHIPILEIVHNHLLSSKFPRFSVKLHSLWGKEYICSGRISLTSGRYAVTLITMRYRAAKV